MTTRWVPKRFINDHIDRELPAPAILRERAKSYLIDTADPAMSELLSDARYYADPFGPDEQPRGLRAAAVALLKATA